ESRRPCRRTAACAWRLQDGARPCRGGPHQGPPDTRSASHRTRRPSMKSPVVKRSIVVAGHKTSVSLEDAFWKGLKDIADDRDITLSDLVSSIDTDRQQGNLSSAIRLFVLDYYRTRAIGVREPAVPRDLIG